MFGTLPHVKFSPDGNSELWTLSSDDPGNGDAERIGSGVRRERAAAGRRAAALRTERLEPGERVGVGRVVDRDRSDGEIRRHGTVVHGDVTGD